VHAHNRSWKSNSSQNDHAGWNVMHILCRSVPCVRTFTSCVSIPMQEGARPPAGQYRDSESINDLFVVFVLTCRSPIPKTRSWMWGRALRSENSDGSASFGLGTQMNVLKCAIHNGIATRLKNRATSHQLPLAPGMSHMEAHNRDK